MMRKLALISRRSPSDWVSCRSITRNLVKSYELGFPAAGIGRFFLEESHSVIRCRELAASIARFQPDAIAFIDHHPHPGVLLGMLEREFAQWPTLLIHVFGDFTMMANEWLAAERVLKKARPVFVCASPKQQALVRSFLEEGCPGGSAVCIPFPVDVATFFPREGELPDSQVTFLYSGRLSLQKNVLFLMRCFAGYRQFNPESQLWLAGPIDDLGLPYIGKTAPSGLLAWDLVHLRSALFPQQARDKVRYFGDCEPEQIAALISRSTAFVSFSTHSDEDFGMAPAEAACCGAPLVLSDWGGYSAFADILPEGSVQRVAVHLRGGRLLPDLNAGIKALAASAARKPASAERLRISEAAKARFSCEAVGRELARQRGGRPGFTGFSERFRKLAQAYRLSPKAPFRAAEGYSKLFSELYEPYF